MKKRFAGISALVTAIAIAGSALLAPPAVAGPLPASLPEDNSLYVFDCGAQQPVRLFKTDETSGASAPVGEPANWVGGTRCPSKFAFDVTSGMGYTLWYLQTGFRLVSVDPDTGATATVAALSLGGNAVFSVGSIAIDTNGKAYAVYYNSTKAVYDLASLDLSTGVLTVIGSLPSGISNLYNFAIDPTDGKAYVGTDSTRKIYELNLATANAVLAYTAGSISTTGYLGGMQFDSDGRVWFALDGTLYSAEPENLSSPVVAGSILLNGRGKTFPVDLMIARPAPSAIPAVTLQPKDAFVADGGSTELTVAGSGSPTPAVSWEVSKDGQTWSTLAGRTSTTLSLTAQALADSGWRYRAVFTNLVGTTKSNIVTVTVGTAPEWKAPALRDGYKGAAYSGALVATGADSYALAEGDLPAGITLNANGTITGTPTEVGGMLVKVNAKNKFGDATETVGFPIYSAAWKDSSLAGTRKGEVVDDKIQGPDRSDGSWDYSVYSGTVPAGLTVGSNGAVTGTPTAAGDYSFTVRAKDDFYAFDQVVSGRVKAPVPGWTDSELKDGTIGVAYSDTIAAGSADSYSFVSGNLPKGLTVGSDGTISGTPTEWGDFSFTVKASNSDDSKEASISLTIKDNLWVDEQLAAPRVGVAYSDGVTAPKIDGSTWAYSIGEGRLPDGLSLNATTGAITGTPTTADYFWFEVNASNGSLTFTTDLYGAVLNPLPVWTDTETAKGYVGTVYADQVAATGAVSYELVAGDLPDGLELSADGTLSGTPSKAGTFTYTVAAYNEGVQPQTRTPAPAKGDKVEHEITTVIGDAEIALTLEFEAGATIAGSETRISANGLKPGSAYELWMHSEPVLLDTGVIDESGSFAKNVALPANTPAGAHSLILTGVAANGDELTATAWFSVDASGKVVATSYTGPVGNPVAAAVDTVKGALASTGFGAGWLVAPMVLVLLLGGALLLVARRRGERTAK
jgi:hypothetical protein